MKRYFCFSFIIIMTMPVIASAALASSAMWGRTGHFITGEIAQAYMNEQAAKRVSEILGDMTWDEATVWMDVVRRTPEFRHTASWHWVTIPDGMTYEEAEKNPDGDVIEALERKIALLKSGTLQAEEERHAVLMVIHMIGDMHQPLHVGNGLDRGGNDVRVEWLGRSTNLHSLWDTGLLVSWGMEAPEFANAINLITPEIAAEWQSTDVRHWAMESVGYREAVYDLPEDNIIDWQYRNRHFHIIEKRLLQAGVRIAGVLNEIYGN
jgi:hypothetical protein